MSKYAIVIEKAESNYSAYVLDVPGCVATAPTVTGVRRKLLEALETHLELMRKAGETIPPPSAVTDYLEVV